MDEMIDKINKTKLVKSLASEDKEKPIPPMPSDDMDLSAYAELTEAEKAELSAQARATVAEELRSARKKQFLKEQINKHRQLAKPGQRIVGITLDLPGHADRIILDGKSFFHGTTYRVPENVYQTMIDIQSRAWEHENEIGGANRDLYKGRAPVNPIVTPNGVSLESNPDHNRIAPMVKF